MMTIVFVGIALLLLCIILVCILILLPNLDISIQFKGKELDELEEIIFNNQLKRLKKVTGMLLPPYEIEFREPVTDLNGSFYGVIFVKFKELLTDDYLKELEKRIEEADSSSLWCDGLLVTTMIFTLRNDVHEMWLKYGRKHYYGGTYTGGFCIRDERHKVFIPRNGFDAFYFWPFSLFSLPFKFTNQLRLPSKVERIKLLPAKASNI